MADLHDLAAPTTADPDLVAVLTDLFADYRATRATPTAVVDLDRGLWQRLEDLGMTRLTGSESAGGSGGSWVDAAALLGLAAAVAAPVPLAEHDVLGGWLLEAAGLPNDGGLRTVCRPDPSGVALNVTWARDASRVVALWEDRDEWRVADVPADRIGIEERRNLAGEPSDTVEFDVDDLEAGTLVPHEIGEQFHLRGALARSAQVVGCRHQRSPSPRAMTPRRISLVPPRSVKPGRCTMAACRSVSSSSSSDQPVAFRVST